MRRSTLSALTSLLASCAAVGRVTAQSVKRFTDRVQQRLSFLNSPDPAAARAGAKLNGSRVKRGKYKGRLHARKGSRKRGSGRTAAKIKAKASRNAKRAHAPKGRRCHG
jgi:hypothetical protein